MNIIVSENCNPYNNCGGMYLVKNYQSKSIKMDFISLFPEIPIGANKEYTRNSLLKTIFNSKNKIHKNIGYPDFKKLETGVWEIGLISENPGLNDSNSFLKKKKIYIVL